MKNVDEETPGKVLPSQFMRELRPEYYSDTEDRVAYILDKSVFEYHVSTITNRQQSDDFEIFCRKLCERIICPNLRAHTGPDGGGDSKVDTETYPVADEVATRFYIGDANAAQERWAFAYSAKADWKTKAKEDVKKIIGTDRGYTRIFFVTSQYARDKDRAKIEDDLTVLYDVPVTIHDRSWIVEEVIDNDRRDLAYNYLKVGEIKADTHRLGPTDYSRAQQLDSIEKSIETAGVYVGMERQRVTEALLAAQLSRGLELPRIETDGRFARAIRFAEADGIFRQILEAKYEYIWTAFWWFDDFELLNSSYDEFQALALTSSSTADLEFLCNLNQILTNSIIHGHFSNEECKHKERTEILVQALERCLEDPERPNNRLEAQTLLLIKKIQQSMLQQQPELLPEYWQEFEAILEKAKGLGEFDADTLVNFIKLFGPVVGSDKNYSVLVEKTAEFVAERKSEGEAAKILLQRAEQLNFDDNFEIIRLLGKASIHLIKKEYADQFAEAVKLLMLAYRSAGLLWASRASCATLAASLIIEGEQDSQVPISFVPTMKFWALTALDLRQLPDFLFGVQMMNGALQTLPLSDENKTKVQDDIKQLDVSLACFLVSQDAPALHELRDLPDIFEGLGLYQSRTALLYALGYLDLLRSEGSVPEEESDNDVHNLIAMLASQPLAKECTGSFNLRAESENTIETNILGMRIEVLVEGTVQSYLIAETFLATAETFFATAIEQRIAPHTESVAITLIVDSDATEPTFEIEPLDMQATLRWPQSLSPSDFERRNDVHRFLMMAAGDTLAATCLIENADTVLERFFIDDAVQQRLSIVMNAITSHSRMAGRETSQISDWRDGVHQSYPLLPDHPHIERFAPPDEEEQSAGDEGSGVSGAPRSHKKMLVRSVINVPAWNLAAWRGVGYLQFSPDLPPCMALMFENEAGARKIFEQWRERFSTVDENEEIHVSIVRHLPNTKKHNYTVTITGPVAALCRSMFSFKRLIVRKPRGFSSLVSNVCGAGYKSH